MQYDHVVCVVDDALTVPIEVSNDMDVRFLGTPRVVPRLSEEDDVHESSPFVLE